MSSCYLKTCLCAAALMLAGSTAQAGEIFYRHGQKCQCASSGYIVCRDPRDRWSNGYVVGRCRWHWPRLYRDGYKCQRASSGYVVYRDPPRSLQPRICGAL